MRFGCIRRRLVRAVLSSGILNPQESRWAVSRWAMPGWGAVAGLVLPSPAEAHVKWFLRLRCRRPAGRAGERPLPGFRGPDRICDPCPAARLPHRPHRRRCRPRAIARSHLGTARSEWRPAAAGRLRLLPGVALDPRRHPPDPGTDDDLAARPLDAAGHGGLPPVAPDDAVGRTRNRRAFRDGGADLWRPFTSWTIRSSSASRPISSCPDSSATCSASGRSTCFAGAPRSR